MIRSHTRSSSIHLGEPTSPLAAMYHRQPPDTHHPLVLSTPAVSSGFDAPLNRSVTPKDRRIEMAPSGRTWLAGGPDKGPMICGMPIKYFSLITLAVQNASLSIVMHYSRVSIPSSRAYSPAAAVLLNELIKGGISFTIALIRAKDHNIPPTSRKSIDGIRHFSSMSLMARIRAVNSEVFSRDCWKLSIPAILYVIQNSLQFVAVGNLPVASFQVSYQMKILTTAAFSVMLLGKRLSPTRWLALLCLALGVAIVQIQTSGSNYSPSASTITQHAVVGSAADAAPVHMHIMYPLKGFAAVSAACFTSGLAGVYFEMVLKNSKADLWVRNVQLSLFSIIPALLPLIVAAPYPDSKGLFADLFRNFGAWAWATVLIQVFGGLVTALVIKYSDNIMKGFATSLSIILSFLASVVLFDFYITPAFLFGATIVLTATWLYNQPGKDSLTSSTGEKGFMFSNANIDRSTPIIGQLPSDKKISRSASPLPSVSSLLRMTSKENLAAHQERDYVSSDSNAYLSAHYGSPYPSRTPSPSPGSSYPSSSRTSLSSLRHS